MKSGLTLNVHVCSMLESHSWYFSNKIFKPKIRRRLHSGQRGKTAPEPHIWWPEGAKKWNREHRVRANKSIFIPFEKLATWQSMKPSVLAITSQWEKTLSYPLSYIRFTQCHQIIVHSSLSPHNFLFQILSCFQSHCHKHQPWQPHYKPRLLWCSRRSSASHPVPPRSLGPPKAFPRLSALNHPVLDSPALFKPILRTSLRSASTPPKSPALLLPLLPSLSRYDL